MPQTMLWRYLVISLINLISVSEAGLSITSLNTLDGNGSLKCGSEVTLMCKIQPFDGTMNWKADNETLMNCTAGSCSTHPPYHSNYGFAFERVSGIFNITINPVKFAENMKQFECNDGSVSQFLTTTVKVVPENGTTFLTGSESTNSTNTTTNTITTADMELTLSTGCVYPPENIQLQWFYFKDDENPILYKDGQETLSFTNGSINECSMGDCGGPGVQQLTSTLKFEQDETGEDYYVQAVVTSADTSEKIVLTSNFTYKLKQKGIFPIFKELGTNVGLIVILSIMGIVIVAITVSIFAVMMSRGSANPEKLRIVGN